MNKSVGVKITIAVLAILSIAGIVNAQNILTQPIYVMPVSIIMIISSTTACFGLWKQRAWGLLSFRIWASCVFLVCAGVVFMTSDARTTYLSVFLFFTVICILLNWMHKNAKLAIEMP